jgi:DNA-binding transcriptional regulator YdaS (Cro superfamily)
VSGTRALEAVPPVPPERLQCGVTDPSANQDCPDARLVEAGKAPSVSAVVNDALSERVERGRRIARRWRELTAQADVVQVERMIAHVEAQAAQLPASHRYR